MKSRRSCCINRSDGRGGADPIVTHFESRHLNSPNDITAAADGAVWFVEEISLRKEAQDRTETIRDTVRHTEVEVEDGRITATTGMTTGAVREGSDDGRIVEHIGVAPVRWTPMMLSHEVFRYAQDTPALRAGVPATDGRSSPSRP